MERILADHEATQRRNGVVRKMMKASGDNDDVGNDDDDSSLYRQQSLVALRVLTVDLPEIQEVDTIAIAKDKVILASQLAGGPCVVEDTSLKFTALGGMPGPYIKWFQDRLKCDGLYKILQAYDDKSAVACCTLAFCPAPHADPVLFTGECHGTIVAPVEGRGFGWDSIFVPNASTDGRPFSQMSVKEKNACSHRGRAVRKWATWLGKNHAALLERQEGSSGTLSSTLLPGHKGLDFKVDFPEQ
jgi:inosine triphosphate pyrophosphatase